MATTNPPPSVPSPAAVLAASAAAARSAWAWAMAARSAATRWRSASSPVVRTTRFKVPCGGISSARPPARSSAISRSKLSGVWAPTKRWLTCTQGARSQSARHSASSRVMAPSAVVPPALTPSDRSACSSSSAAPPSRQAMLVHTATTWVPTGSVCSMS